MKTKIINDEICKFHKKMIKKYGYTLNSETHIDNSTECHIIMRVFKSEKDFNKVAGIK